MTGRARGFLLAVFVAYLVALAVVLLGPSTQPGETGVSGMLRALWTAGVPVDLATPERVEVLLNVVLLVPLPLIGGGIWPSLTWRDWTAYGFALALGAELWQGLAFEARSATYSDVVANTTGVSWEPLPRPGSGGRGARCPHPHGRSEGPHACSVC